MTPGRVRRGMPLVLAGLLLLPGCLYFNTVYNAQLVWDQAEAHRLAGRPDSARLGYEALLERASKAYRADPEGGWAHASLLLVGQAHLRLGHRAQARAALEEVLRTARDPELLDAARVFLAASLEGPGNLDRALLLLNAALDSASGADLRGEGHMWRARMLLRSGFVDQGWWDLDRALEASADLAVPGHLERLAWGIRWDDRARAREGANALLAMEGGDLWADSLLALVRGAARRWGEREGAYLLTAAREAPWRPGVRDAVLLERTRLLLSDGDSLAVESELGWMARGRSPGAPEARRRLAMIRLRRSESVRDLEGVRRLLLPSADDEATRDLLARIQATSILAGVQGEGRFSALFAAAEWARDELGAPALARALFTQALEAPSGPWHGKAYLAARALADEVEDGEGEGPRSRRPWDEYTALTESRYLPGFRAADVRVAELEEGLQLRLDSLRSWALAEAALRDAAIRTRGASR